ncbi:MAG: glycoside hydrolase [Pseudopedobacter saltans]|uniref:Glycoside hydrolase n=1 Tax=Pseudopedobacter saltans TaxID=151895 RepID=A0A2W5EPW2_9SPHI|nr:MAG: glycoside hydrolase [Pseudopedobacter saltans]
MQNFKKYICLLIVVSFLINGVIQAQMQRLEISKNKRFFQTADGNPFFWLGDTGWLLFVKLNREEVVQYLDARKAQGFNVIQVMVIHNVKNTKNAYGDYAIENGNIAKPIVTKGNDFSDATQYDFWDHVDFVIKEAEKRGMYMALVPIWGSNVKEKKVTVEQAKIFSEFLANRYKNTTNIIWLNGGDIRGTDGMPVWNMIGKTIKSIDKNHLMTFHPRGRYSSSEWFQNASWMDFNMFQSGHRDYAQDTSASDKNHFGEDNWKFINVDYNLKPTKPTLDGEPSYENIPHGLHDSLAARWNAADIRRYAYWSVFAGGAGFTYGENAMMQFNRKGQPGSNYGVTNEWMETLQASGAVEIHHIKDLMTRFPYFDRKPAQDILIGNVKTKYDYLLATKGDGYALVYSYVGRTININEPKLGFTSNKISWFNPSNGESVAAQYKRRGSVLRAEINGDLDKTKDWVLILEK